MDSSDALQAARDMRRAVLGDDYAAKRALLAVRAAEAGA
jgi:hypothetical protein